MAYVSVKDIFPFFGSNTLGQKELSEYNLTRSIRCLNTGNNAFATSASNTPFNLTTTASPITPGSSSTIEFTLGEGEGEIGGYYVKIENTTSVKLEGNWQAEGVFYLHLNMTSRGLKYVSEYSEINESALELKYASDGIITDREYSLKIAELIESSGKLVVTYSCHRGLINNIDLTYGSDMRERFLGDGIYYYLNKDITTYTTKNSNIKLRKGGIEIKDINSIESTVDSFISMVSQSTSREQDNQIYLGPTGIQFINKGGGNTYNEISLSSAGTTINAYKGFYLKQSNETFLDINYHVELGHVSRGTSIQGSSIGLITTGKVGISGGTGIDIINGQQKIKLDASNVTIQSNTTNGTTTLSGKNVSLTSLLSSGTTSLNGYKTTIRSKNETLIGSNTTTKIATYDATEQLTSYIKLGELGLDIEVATSKINSPGLLKIISGDVVIYEGDSWFIDITNDKTHIKSVNTTIGGTATITGATTMSSTLEVDGKITAKKQISASNVIHSDSNVTANGNVTAKGNVTANNGNDILGSGTLKLNNVAMVDFVVEEGTKTVEGFAWKFRKWKNGRYEAWCSDSYSATFIAPSKSSVKPICQAVPSAHTVWLPAVSNSIVYFNASVMGESPSCNCMGCSLTYNDKKAFPRPWRTDGSDTQTETTSTISLRYYVVYENVT